MLRSLFRYQCGFAFSLATSPGHAESPNIGNITIPWDEREDLVAIQGKCGSRREGRHLPKRSRRRVRRNCWIEANQVIYGMIQSLLEQLRTKVENAHGLSSTAKSELLKLVADLDRQSGGTATIQPAAAKRGMDQLTDLVKELEVSHPEITSLANRIATMLGNLGV